MIPNYDFDFDPWDYPICCNCKYEKSIAECSCKQRREDIKNGCNKRKTEFIVAILMQMSFKEY